MKTIQKVKNAMSASEQEKKKRINNNENYSCPCIQQNFLLKFNEKKKMNCNEIEIKKEKVNKQTKKK